MLKVSSFTHVKSSFTNGYLVAVLPETYPAVSKNAEIEVATSNDQDPREGKARSCFSVERLSEGDAYDEYVRWGEKVYITIKLAGLDKVWFRL
jgi:hypothetical protein